MTYFLDTNTCIYFLTGRFGSVRRRLLSRRPAEIVIPSLVKGELLYGARKSVRSEENLRIVRQFLQPYAAAEFGDNEAEHYSEIRSALEQLGTPIGTNDLIIASVVLSNDGTLVTHNTREFQRVSGLKVEDWVELE